MLRLSKTNARPRKAADYEWITPDGDLTTEFRAIAAAALAFVKHPPTIGPCYAGYVQKNDRDNVITGARSPINQQVLFGLARTLGFGSYIEVGTRMGYSIGAAMAGSRKLSRAITIDPFVNREQIMANLASLGRDDVDFDSVIMPSRDFDTDERFEVAYVDGDHTYEAAFGDLLQYWQYVKPGGLMFTDDTINDRGDANHSREQMGVYWACQDFLAQTDDVAAGVLKLPTYSGLAIFQKKD